MIDIWYIVNENVIVNQFMFYEGRIFNVLNYHGGEMQIKWLHNGVTQYVATSRIKQLEVQGKITSL